jgi:general secretion pathway protein A
VPSTCRPYRLRDAKGNEGYAALGALDEEFATLDLLEGNKRLAVAGIDAAWQGDYLIVWQPPPMGSGAIGPGASRDAVRWLRKLLSQVPDLAVKDTGSGTFDAAVEEGVRRFQQRVGLTSDGVAGPRTLIRLYNAVAMPGIPRLKPAP